MQIELENYFFQIKILENKEIEKEILKVELDKFFFL